MSGLAILKPDHLGDLVLSAPAIRAVRARRSDVTLFVSSDCVALAKFLFPDIADVRVADLAHLARGRGAVISTECLVRVLDDFECVLSIRDDPVLRTMIGGLRVPMEMVEGDPGIHETILQRRAAARVAGWYSRTPFFSADAPSWPTRLRHVALCVAAGFPTNRWANSHWFGL